METWSKPRTEWRQTGIAQTTHRPITWGTKTLSTNRSAAWSKTADSAPESRATPATARRYRRLWLRGNSSYTWTTMWVVQTRLLLTGARLNSIDFLGSSHIHLRLPQRCHSEPAFKAEEERLWRWRRDRLGASRGRPIPIAAQHFEKVQETLQSARSSGSQQSSAGRCKDINLNFILE